jgi:uncharacterized membrane protein YkvA (DUF1232 family)
MPLWAWLLVAVGAIVLALALGALLLNRGLPPERRRLASEMLRLPWRAKAGLFWALLSDRRVPLWLRAVLPLLALYLVMPFDIIPDFIPVIGYLDDALVIALAAGVLLRFVPADVIEERIAVARPEPGGGAGL